MGLIKALRSQLVVLTVPANAPGTVFYFPDQPQINRNGMVIDAIEAFCADDMTVTPSGVAVITAAQMKTAYLTMYVNEPANSAQGQGEQYNLIPLTSLHRIQSSATPFFVRDMLGLPGTRLDWSKTTISCGTSLGNASPVAFVLQVYYHKAIAGTNDSFKVRKR